MTPERLVDRPEWKGAFQSLAKERLDDARLARGAERLRAALAAGAAGAGAGLLASGAKSAGVAAAKGAGFSAVGAKVVISLALVAGLGAAAGLGTAIVWKPEPPPPMNREARVVVPAKVEDREPEAAADDAADEAVEIAPVPEDGRPIVQHKPHRRRGKAHHAAPPAKHAIAADDPIEIVRDALPVEPEPESERASDVAPPKHEEKHGDAPLWPRPDRTPEPKPAPAAKSAEAPKERDLEAELRLFHAAESEVKKGDAGRGLEKLDALERDFPKSPLGPEIALLRAEGLVRASRIDDAIAFIQSTVEARWPPAKKAELYRTLGDLYAARHACKDATSAYARALALGLKGERAQRARAATRECVDR